MTLEQIHQFLKQMLIIHTPHFIQCSCFYLYLSSLFLLVCICCRICCISSILLCLSCLFCWHFQILPLTFIFLFSWVLLVFVSSISLPFYPLVLHLHHPLLPHLMPYLFSCSFSFLFWVHLLDLL